MSGYSFVLHTQACLGRFNGLYSKGQKILDNAVLRDSDPYVPMRSGFLKNSGVSGTVIGSGNVRYNAPYAKKVYYAQNVKFSKTHHPQACAQWFEKAKAAKKSEWLAEVNREIKGGG